MRKSFTADEPLYFTADLHFGHRAMVTRDWGRPYTSIDEMDEALIANWNTTVGPNDTIFILGDVSFRNAARTLEIIPDLHGKKHLILGNHDKNLSHYALSLFDGVAAYHEIKYDGTLLTLCHYPMRSWNQMHYGSWNLHGHSHGNIKDRWRHQVDVGVDCWDYRPVSIDQILALPQPEAPTYCDHHTDTARFLRGLRNLQEESEQLGLYD